MTEKERLSELLEKAIRYADENYKGRPFDGKFCGLMADYLMTNGVIAPSCKKGDIAYRLAHGYVEKEQVRCVYFQYLTNGYGFTEDDIGKVAFIGEGAKEEAEKALAERKQK